MARSGDREEPIRSDTEGSTTTMDRHGGADEAPAPELMDRGAAAALLACTAENVRKLADAGRLRTYRTPTGRRYYLRADVERLAAERAAARRTA